MIIPNSTKIIKQTANASLLLQIITGIIDLFVLKYDLREEDQILKELLIAELSVQIVEGGFYVWLVNSFDKVENITVYRYYDWVFTTPVMLLTLILYLIYLRYTEELDNNIKINKKINKKKIILNYFTLIKENWKNIVQVILLNESMLFFGYLNEIGKINKYQAVILGFIPFIMMFKIIYDNYAKYTKKGLFMFKYFVIVWGFYGIVALMDYSYKNISYNILDLFSKNFFGLYLSYKIYKNKK
jgi:hypothetical protein